MQLMTWTLARLGSRFSLLFEPYFQRVRHSALGRFLDQPMDLMVGLIEPDGTHRVLPFTKRGTPLYNPEQFERLNSITFRGYSEQYRLRFEFNIHSVFYPQNEPMCIIPAFYMEMRISACNHIRWTPRIGPTPEKVKLFIRLDRCDTEITAWVPPADQQAGSGDCPAPSGRIDLAYQNTLIPAELRDGNQSLGDDGRTVQVYERITSLNPGCTVDDDGRGLILELPVTGIGSGVKWRLVWGAHCSEEILNIGVDHVPYRASFKYVSHWSTLDAVMDEAVRCRDDWLAHSRRFEKLMDQAPLRMAHRHLVHQSFQAFLSNTFWASFGDDTAPRDQWFSVWEGSCYRHARIDVEYNVSMLYLAIWPQLLGMQLDQWTAGEKPHKPSAGSYLSHDMGAGLEITGQSYPHDMPVEENCNYLLLMQAYAHWTGDLSIAQRQSEVLERLANYLIWTDRDGCGFASEGTANTIDDASPATQYSRKQTYLAIKRLAALQAAGDLLSRTDRADAASKCEQIVSGDTGKIEQQAWLGDHYVVCIDRTAAGIKDAWSGEALPFEEIPGWDAYSIYTCNGLLLPAMTAQPTLLDPQRMHIDLTNATRETLSNYGCGHSSYEVDNVWVSQNLWRDHLARYLGTNHAPWTQRYWDLQVMSNTHHQSLGYCDTYIGNNLSFNPRGVTSLGYLLAYPRLIIDRLAPGGTRISVDPDRHFPQRWPLLPLADWQAGKIPICVVDPQGKVTIECQTDPIIIHGQKATADQVIG